LKNTNWKDIAELLGIAAIVASLVFVGLQMKQTHEIAIAAQYQARAEATLAMFTSHLEAGYTIPPFRDKLSESLTAEDIAMANWQWTTFDNNFYQYQAGFLEEEAWERLKSGTKPLWNNCHARIIWNVRKGGLRPELVALIESWDDPC
jgi:hypothetical protein